MPAILGTPLEGGPAQKLDLDLLLTSRLLLQANSGAGKSWALRRLLEQTHGQVQQLVFDPEGEFATLRERFDYVLAARQGGDVLADPRSAKLLIEKLLELRVNAILDIYELKVHERVLFVRRALEALVNAPRTLWHPALVVIDEAHAFCPQKGEAESRPAVIDLCARGRKRGFCAVLATQRLSKLDKDAAAECNNKLIGRSALDVDMDRAAEELGFKTKDQKLSLRDLGNGQFYAFGPALTRAVTLIQVGAVETTHPKAGARAVGPPAPSDKVKAVLAKLSDLPAEAEAREKTLEELRKENASLKAQVTKAQKGQPAAPPDPRLAERVKALTDQVAELKKAAALNFDKQLNGLHVASLDLWKKFEKLTGELSAQIGRVKREAPSPTLPAPRLPAPRVVPSPPLRPVPRAPIPVNGDEQITRPQQRILNALAWLESVGIPEPEQPAVAFLANYKYGTGGFNNPKGRLNQRGLIQYLTGDRMQLTDAGREYAQFPDAVLTTDELHRMVLNKLPNPEQRILQPLLAVWPEGLSVEDAAREANYEPGTGGFNNPRGRLRTLGLIEYPTPGQLRARDILFLPDRSR